MLFQSNDSRGNSLVGTTRIQRKRHASRLFKCFSLNSHLLRCRNREPKEDASFSQLLHFCELWKIYDPFNNGLGEAIFMILLFRQILNSSLPVGPFRFIWLKLPYVVEKRLFSAKENRSHSMRNSLRFWSRNGPRFEVDNWCGGFCSLSDWMKLHFFQQTRLGHSSDKKRRIIQLVSIVIQLLYFEALRPESSGFFKG